MTRKKRFLFILVGAAVGSAAIYFLATKSGRKSWQRLKKEGAVTADIFTTLGEEVARNVEQTQKEERNKALKAFVQEALTTEA